MHAPFNHSRVLAAIASVTLALAGCASPGGEPGYTLQPVSTGPGIGRIVSLCATRLLAELDLSGANVAYSVHDGAIDVTSDPAALTGPLQNCVVAANPDLGRASAGRVEIGTARPGGHHE
jgi:hypothetical protein